MGLAQLQDNLMGSISYLVKSNEIEPIRFLLQLG